MQASLERVADVPQQSAAHRLRIAAPADQRNRLGTEQRLETATGGRFMDRVACQVLFLQTALLVAACPESY
jgi:hypothetical protein